MGMDDAMQHGGAVITTAELRDYDGPKKTDGTPKDKVTREIVGEVAGKSVVSDSSDVKPGETQILNG